MNFLEIVGIVAIVGAIVLTIKCFPLVKFFLGYWWCLIVKGRKPW